MILYRLRDTLDKVLREEYCSLRKGRGWFDQIFTLRLMIKKCHSFIYYERAVDSVDRRAFAKVLSLFSIPDKYIKLICAMYENNTAAVKVGN